MEEGLACNFSKSNSSPWVFFTFYKLYKWYQIKQRTTNKRLWNALTGTSFFFFFLRCSVPFLKTFFCLNLLTSSCVNEKV